jgi:2-aminoethylphosphonate-pyruvate transaminase
MSIDTAIIMAAGLGSRIAAFSRTAPKGFITVGGQALVARSIAALAERGIRRIVIGTGHLAEDYQALARGVADVQVECVHNPDYARSGSLETFLLCARDLGCDFLSLESDLLYDPRMIDQVLATPFANSMLGSGQTDSGDEVYIETDEDLNLVNLSKNKAALSHVDAELVGICKLGRHVPAAIEAWMASAGMQRPAQIHYEDGLVGIAGTVAVHIEKTDLAWTEIDTPDHLARANALIWPRIVAARMETT